jgi:hypothetical protein
MTNNNAEHRPAWRDAWRLDDPDWVKARQRAWKTIKNSAFIKEVLMPNKDELKKIKNFYLTGSGYDPEPPPEEWRWNSYHPDTKPVPVTSAMLVELWLTADDSENNWLHIDEKYSQGSHRSARDRFRSALHRLYPEHGSIFDGREARIYAMLKPTRCRLEDYPDRPDRTFNRTCSAVNSELGSPIRAHLLSEQSTADSFTPMLASEWCDTVLGAYQHNVFLAEDKQNPGFISSYFSWVEDILSASQKIAHDPGGYHSTQVELSQKIITYLSELDMPQPLQDVLGKYLD